MNPDLQSQMTCMCILKGGCKIETGMQRVPLTRALRHKGHLSALDALVHLENGEGSNIIVDAREITSGGP